MQGAPICRHTGATEDAARRGFAAAQSASDFRDGAPADSAVGQKRRVAARVEGPHEVAKAVLELEPSAVGAAIVDDEHSQVLERALQHATPAVPRRARRRKLVQGVGAVRAADPVHAPQHVVEGARRRRIRPPLGLCDLHTLSVDRLASRSSPGHVDHRLAVLGPEPLDQLGGVASCRRILLAASFAELARDRVHLSNRRPFAGYPPGWGPRPHAHRESRTEPHMARDSVRRASRSVHSQGDELEAVDVDEAAVRDLQARNHG